jgi:deoxyribodipyrimidine photo-lyase
MAVVWLKRDVRIHDHGPLAEAAQSKNPFVILYLFEQDQLRHPTVHGSHVRFIYEGLVDLENTFKKNKRNEEKSDNHDINRADTLISEDPFEHLTVCHNTAIATLTSIHQTHPIARLLAHEETGHWESYMRDRSVRKWCRNNRVQFLEYNQTGVTRRLKNRDDYNKHWKKFMAIPRHATPNIEQLRGRIVQLRDLPGFISILKIKDVEQWNAIFTEIPATHRHDRSGRQQFGGETKALATLDSFLQERGSRFSLDISSPNTAWNSCSRLSPYLAWGHVSLRYVLFALQQRKETLTRMKAQGRNTGTWLKSLQAFSSRLHWRSHFLQKLESEPTMELRDLCPAYQHLRRQEGDWNEDYFTAWATGTTGFPFVDACMRCLLEHGWINFRMRAMLVSFACYNLWLDWKRIAPHLARLFLDFEPGIHYPQLQMQAGTTGINAMRVYSVTKQGKEQDPTGKFIRRYVTELERVPDKYIYEPWRMPKSTQDHVKVTILHPKLDSSASISSFLDEESSYPAPVVNEQESAKMAKAKLTQVRKQESTKHMANQVFLKHGSRSVRSHAMNGRVSGTGALPGVKVSMAEKIRQPKIMDAFEKTFDTSLQAASKEHMGNVAKRPVDVIIDEQDQTYQQLPMESVRNKKSKLIQAKDQVETMESLETQSALKGTQRKPDPDGGFFSPSESWSSSWHCRACTFLNENKPYAWVCAMCGTPKTK